MTIDLRWVFLHPPIPQGSALQNQLTWAVCRYDDLGNPSSL